jgi:hypothetical protein
MIPFRKGKVVEIVKEQDLLVRTVVQMQDGDFEAIGFPKMVGRIRSGDTVVVNMTGLDLRLGTGGIAFILWNLDGSGPERTPPGHIMKLRYTPWQRPVVAAEAPESPHHLRVQNVTSIESMPVVACGLHSQLAGVVAGIKAVKPDARVGYLMTDGGALPLALSRLVMELRAAGLLDVTCTSGHAFGGDLESINIFSGLVALTVAGRCDAVVVAMGPGVVGTGTALGYSAIEQGQALDAATALEGRAVAAVRLSFHDERERHRGVSHHTLTALSIGARERATVVVPDLDGERAAQVLAQLRGRDLPVKHDIVSASGEEGLELLRSKKLDPSSMGRTMSEAPELFLAAAAAGAVAVDPTRGTPIS